MSRNKRYEAAKQSAGLAKLTLWVPVAVMADFQFAARVCCENRDLTVSNLRSLRTGRLVSMERAVTGDNQGLAHGN